MCEQPSWPLLCHIQDLVGLCLCQQSIMHHLDSNDLSDQPIWVIWVWWWCGRPLRLWWWLMSWHAIAAAATPSAPATPASPAAPAPARLRSCLCCSCTLLRSFRALLSRNCATLGCLLSGGGIGGLLLSSLPACVLVSRALLRSLSGSALALSTARLCTLKVAAPFGCRAPP